jgi:hypothetical protein
MPQVCARPAETDCQDWSGYRSLTGSGVSFTSLVLDGPSCPAVPMPQHHSDWSVRIPHAKTPMLSEETICQVCGALA